MNHKLSDEEIAERKALIIDPCPWCPDTQPGVSVKLEGSSDDPYVVIEMKCPKCHVSRRYGPTEKEVQKHYSSRYSPNHEMIMALWPKLAKTWNWKTKPAPAKRAKKPQGKDMNHSIIVYGPQSCGKTTNAEALKKNFGLDKIVDEGKLGSLLKDGPALELRGVLYLCVDIPRKQALGMITMKYEDAARLAGIK